MNLSLDEGFQDLIRKGNWKEIENRLPNIESLDTVCLLAHIAITVQNHNLLKAAVSRTSMSEAYSLICL